MDTITLGLFYTQESAANAINELSRNGISSKDISIVMRDQGAAKEVGKTTGAHVAEGIATGVTAGGILGGLTGLLVGIGAIVVPGIGGILVAGPIVAVLGFTGAGAGTVTGALTGGLAGGLLGGLIGLGLPESEALAYERDIKTGGILLGIPTTDSSEPIVRQILQNNHASQVRSVSRDTVLV